MKLERHKTKTTTSSLLKNSMIAHINKTNNRLID